MSHYVMKCKHGVVVSQCRCMSPSKSVIIVPCPPQCPTQEQVDAVWSSPSLSRQAIDWARRAGLRHWHEQGRHIMLIDDCPLCGES